MTPTLPGNTIQVTGTVNDGLFDTPTQAQITGTKNVGGIMTTVGPVVVPLNGASPFNYDSGTALGGFSSGSWTITVQPLNANNAKLGNGLATGITVP